MQESDLRILTMVFSSSVSDLITSSRSVDLQESIVMKRVLNVLKTHKRGRVQHKKMNVMEKAVKGHGGPFTMYLCDAGKPIVKESWTSLWVVNKGGMSAVEFHEKFCSYV